MEEFEKIDPILSEWGRQNDIVWLSEYQGSQVRTYFINAESRYRTQVWVDPVKTDEIFVHVFQLGTRGKVKKQEMFVSSLETLQDFLTKALEIAKL